MKLHYVVLFFLASVTALSAQTVPPALMVQQDGHSLPLGLAKLQTEVRILGGVAETTTTMTFANQSARAMEGDLYFPLPEGATISGYALDINGVMVDGVAVEKHEARRIFEEVERHGIDPGLVQWTKGNNFQTRVFPIPAHGSRTVRVSYVTELVGGKEAPAYHLPLKFKDKIHEFSLRVEVVKAAVAPQVTKGELANFAFAKWHDSFVAETKQVDWLPVEDLVIALPKADGPQVVVEKADDGQTYFAVEDNPAGSPREAGELVSEPEHVVIFWDASGSRAGDHKREVALLRAYFQEWLNSSDAAIGDIRIDLVLLRNAASKPERILIRRAGPAGLVAALEKVQYDGGTQLGAIAPLSAGGKPDFYMIFTDGISNFGREEPAPLDAPAYVFSADAEANHAFLQSLAMSSGGRYFNLANWKDADVLAGIGHSAWSFLSAAVEGGQVKDVYPQLSQPAAGGFTLVGKLTGETAKVTINCGFPGREPDKQTFKVSRADAVDGSLLRRLWAQKKLEHLMIHQKANEKEIAALGKEFGLVTPYTSLLVLDTLEQYVQYEIAPPKSLAAMREEYARRIDTLEHQKRKEKADKLAEVVRMWDERVKWWNNEFKYAKDFKYQGEPEGSEGGRTYRSVEWNRLDAAPAPRPEPPLPTALQPPREMSAVPKPASAEPPRGAAAPVPSSPAPAPAACAPAPATATGARDDQSKFKELERLIRETEPTQARSTGDVNHFRTNLSLTISQSQEVHESGSESVSRQPGIVIKPWQPDLPYLKDLRAAKGKAEQWAVYMKNRAQYGTSPGFFLDCSDFFREPQAGATGDADLALQVLSNIAELELEDAALLRVLAYRLLQVGQLNLAVQTFEQVLEMRPEEPQSYRDLALALARRAEETIKAEETRKAFERDQRERHDRGGIIMAPKVQLWNGQPFVWQATVAPEPSADYARAINLLSQVVMGHWDQRFPEIEVIALEEVNRIIPRAKAVGVSVIPLDPRLIKLLDVDVRIVMTWSADNTDIDLWVTEPSSEKAFYNHNRTTIGGLVSHDFTQGYGPEEYLVRRAAHGMYKIDANYFGSQATQLLGPVTVQVDVFTNFGRANEQRKSLTLRLKDAKETVRIGEIEF